MAFSAKHFPSKLRSIRESKGYTQAELGKRAKLSNTWISHYENNVRHPSLENFAKICSALNVLPHNLLEK